VACLPKNQVWSDARAWCCQPTCQSQTSACIDQVSMIFYGLKILFKK
jgi:hypothetical protein